MRYFKILLLCFFPILAFGQVTIYVDPATNIKAAIADYNDVTTIRIKPNASAYFIMGKDINFAPNFILVDAPRDTAAIYRVKMTVEKVVIIQEPTLPAPFKPLSIPGTIQAEDYNPSGVNDVDKLNSGTNKIYRTDHLDLEGTTLINVGWNYTGDWLEYTVDVAQAKAYTFSFRVAALDPGGALNLQVNGQTIGTVNVPDTNGWQTYQTVSFTAPLTAGKKLLRLNVVNGPFNIDSISVQ